MKVASRETRLAVVKRSPFRRWSHSPTAYIKRIPGPNKKLPCMFAQMHASIGKVETRDAPRNLEVQISGCVPDFCLACSATDTNTRAKSQENMCGRANQ